MAQGLAPVRSLFEGLFMSLIPALFHLGDVRYELKAQSLEFHHP